MSDVKSKTIQQESGSSAIPSLRNTITQTPILIYQRRSRPQISPSTDNSGVGEGKSISNSPKAPFAIDDGELQTQFGGIELEMVVEVENIHSPLTSGGEDNYWNRPTSKLESSSLHVETGSMSDSDHWYRPSLPSTASDDHNSDNMVLLEVNTVESSTNSNTYPNLLKALTLSIPRRPRTSLLRAPALKNKTDGDTKPTYEESVSECEVKNYRSRERVVVNHEDECQSKKRKRKSGGVFENEEELEGLHVVYVNGQKIDLDFLARVGDGAYEEELASVTSGMSRAKLVGFMESLEGEWVGRGERRRRVVDAEEFVNALPVNWKIELALRKRGGIPSVYCRRYVSTSGIHFKSCKEAALYLRDQSLSNVAEEEASEEMRQMNDDACHKVPKSVNEVGSSSVPEANVKLPAIDNLFDVKVGSFIDCSSCGIPFENIRALEKHLASAHKKTTRIFDLPTMEKAGNRASEKHTAMDTDVPNLDKPYAQQNGEGSSSSRKIAKTQESVGISNARFKTNCTWCNKGFLCEPVDAETMADATGFMCPQCKDKICGGFERSLSRSSQH